MYHYVAKAGSERRQYCILLTWALILASTVESGNWQLDGRSVFGACSGRVRYFALFYDTILYFFLAYVEPTLFLLLLHEKILECSPYEWYNTSYINSCCETRSQLDGYCPIDMSLYNFVWTTGPFI